MIYIRDEKELLKKISKIKEAGKETLHILTDFDKTLTSPFLPNGEKAPNSVVATIRTKDYLKNGYIEKATALFNKYHPIETCPDIPVEEKTQAMEKWWREHFNLMSESGLTRDAIEKALKENPIYLRENAKELIEILKDNNIPMVVMSAGFCYGMRLIIKRDGIDYNGLHLIANVFKFDDNGRVISIKEPIIHSMNKSEVAIKAYPDIYENVKNRKNVILMGDNTSDIDMITGFEYDNIIKIGFLKPDYESLLEDYLKVFDIVAEPNSDLSFVIELLGKLYK